MMTVSEMREEVAGTDAAIAVRLHRVSKLYGSFVALRNVSLTLPAGSSVVLLGENGAGKSTVLKLVSGLASPTYGGVTVFGERPQSQRGAIGTMGHATMLYDELTAMENLTYFAQMNGLGESRSELEHIAASAMREVGLDPALTRHVSEFSQGMRQRASLARVLMAKPQLLLLDEPFSNLDIGSARGMVERLIAYLSEPGEDGLARTLLLTTHQHELARPLAKTTVTLSGGQISLIEGDDAVVAGTEVTA
ncbi:ABC transporter ATP-binding protein [Granulicella paludicola]|uniref:ABC transporter ATP-binding protein n=1 Tax=Granulicella paludicola TaxID=474951 RepID=UPI0021DFC978|nr:ABC transporter ATP-binding protein [Granulicella paludicola]